VKTNRYQLQIRVILKNKLSNYTKVISERVVKIYITYRRPEVKHHKGEKVNE